MYTMAVVSSSEKALLCGIGFLLGGILVIIGIKSRLIPNLPIKWGIAIVGILLGAVLIAVGIFKK
jgi:hypothetical protein